MTPDTDDLIGNLAGQAKPVRLLPRPWRRTTVWFAGAVVYVAAVVLVLAPRDDLASKVTDQRFLIEAVTALATGVIAAFAAFATVVPGYSRTALALLALPLAAWIGSLGVGCLRDWIELGPRGMALATDWGCFPAILASGGVPTLAMAVMLRRGAPLTPALSMALGGLAAGALADFGMRFHHHEVGVMPLVWHLAAVLILLTAAARTGRRVLKWQLVT
jgi:hypothetical protein